jgi:hypothetical protein
MSVRCLQRCRILGTRAPCIMYHLYIHINSKEVQCNDPNQHDVSVEYNIHWADAINHAISEHFVRAIQGSVDEARQCRSQCRFRFSFSFNLI